MMYSRSEILAAGYPITQLNAALQRFYKQQRDVKDVKQQQQQQQSHSLKRSTHSLSAHKLSLQQMLKQKEKMTTVHCDPPSVKCLVEELKAAGYSATQCHDAGYTLRDLLKVVQEAFLLQN